MQLLGKNMLAKLVDLMKQPKFIFYMICLLCDKKRTKAELSKKKQTDLKASNPVNNEEKRSEALNENIVLNEANNDVVDQSSQSLSDFKEKYDHNLYQEFNERNLNSFKSFTYSASYYDSSLNSQILSLEITDAETNYELKTGKQYTSYNIKIEFGDRSLNEKAPMTRNTFTKTIKRRFKEFVALQKKLEENNLYRSFLKNVKGPSKFINLSIGNMEEIVIEKRRKKLDQFLKVDS